MVRGRTHFFGAYERDTINNSRIIALPPASVLAATGNGVFPAKSHDALSTLRLDDRLNTQHALSIRYNHENQQSLRSAAVVTSDTSQVDTFNRSHSLVVEEIWTIRYVAAEAATNPPPGHTQAGSCLVQTDNGAVQGLDLGSSCAFLGVPYAASTSGSRRWKPPQPAAPWASPLNVTAPPGPCAGLSVTGVPAGSEDCLKLNIWVSDPTPATPAPVIVWLHTGGFTGASANFPSHKGERLTEETGVIVVAPNYRLGALGFLARRLARMIEDTTTPVFQYAYEYEIDDLAVNRVIHGVESNIVFGNNYAPPIFPNHVLNTADTTLHEALGGYWTRFARTGNPNSDDESVVHWPAFKDPTGPGRGRTSTS